MTYINNQYLRLDILLEEIAKIEIKTDEKNKMISDLEIKDFEPNIVIAFGINNIIDYNNIFSSVRILITDGKTLKGKIEEIPEFIEVVIVSNKIYYNKNERESDKEFDLLSFENDMDRFEMKVERLIEKGKINSYNKIGDTILNYLIVYNKEEKALELIERMKIESINKANKYGGTALMFACYKDMGKVALKLLEIEGIDVNKVNNFGEILIYAVQNRMEGVVKRINELKKK
jgi:hypothetical protein